LPVIGGIQFSETVSLSANLGIMARCLIVDIQTFVGMRMQMPLFPATYGKSHQGIRKGYLLNYGVRSELNKLLNSGRLQLATRLAGLKSSEIEWSVPASTPVRRFSSQTRIPFSRKLISTSMAGSGCDITVLSTRIPTLCSVDVATAFDKAVVTF
jgi:hypothetical protein